MQGQTKAPVEGPRAPQAVKGNPMYALGRLPSGVMNKTEERYLDQVIKPMMLSGELVWWAFEGIKLRLADHTFLEIDFAQMRSTGVLELVDVKGAEHLITDDANVKMKVAAERFPFPLFFAWPAGKRGFHVRLVGRG